MVARKIFYCSFSSGWYNFLAFSWWAFFEGRLTELFLPLTSNFISIMFNKGGDQKNIGEVSKREVL